MASSPRSTRHSSPSAIMPNAVQAEDYAVIVGIDTYPRLPRALAGARNDVEAFREWLTDPNEGGLSPANVFKLISPPEPPDPPEPPHPGNDAIDGAFETLIDLA